jgi:hypothetical protein
MLAIFFCIAFLFIVSLFVICLLRRKKRIPFIANPNFIPTGRTVATVDYDLPLAESIAAANLKEINDEIVSGFFPNKMKGKKELCFAVITFEKDPSTEYVLEQFEACGLRPATVEELLAFWFYWAQKGKLWTCIIVALGSNGQSIHDGVVAPSIDGKRRWLRLSPLKRDWFAHCRFLGVYKDAPK